MLMYKIKYNLKNNSEKLKNAIDLNINFRELDVIK